MSLVPAVRDFATNVPITSDLCLNEDGELRKPFVSVVTVMVP